MELVQRITEEVADREDSSPMDLPPINETLDSQALQELVESAEADTLAIEFVYCGYTVRVEGDGDVEVGA